MDLKERIAIRAKDAAFLAAYHPGDLDYAQELSKLLEMASRLEKAKRSRYRREYRRACNLKPFVKGVGFVWEWDIPCPHCETWSNAQ